VIASVEVLTHAPGSACNQVRDDFCLSDESTGRPAPPSTSDHSPARLSPQVTACDFVDLWNNKPDFKGIETSCEHRAIARCCKWNNQPDFKGIETCARPRCPARDGVERQAQLQGHRSHAILGSTKTSWRWNNKPDFKGVESLSGVPPHVSPVQWWNNKPGFKGIETRSPLPIARSCLSEAHGDPAGDDGTLRWTGLWVRSAGERRVG
jgi:hypothetical protein